MRVQSRAALRNRWTTWGQTFAAPTDMPCSRLRMAADVVTRVLTGLRHGCPTQALGAAGGVDERPVPAWLTRAGQHGQRVHPHVVPPGCVDRPHVQADARWVQLGGRRVWRALAMAVPSRLGLGGVSSPHRDVRRITALVPLVRSGARSLATLVGGDGLASAVTAVLRVCRPSVRTGRRRRPRWVEKPGRRLGPVVKRDVPRRVGRGARRVVRGTEAAGAVVLTATPSGPGSKTASRARLQATCRASLAPLVRRGRALAHTEAVLTAGMELVGGAYHVCWRHQSLRLAAPAGAPWKWHESIPAMAAGRTDQRWTRLERRRDQGPPPA